MTNETKKFDLYLQQFDKAKLVDDANNESANPFAYIKDINNYYHRVNYDTLGYFTHTAQSNNVIRDGKVVKDTDIRKVNVTRRYQFNIGVMVSQKVDTFTSTFQYVQQSQREMSVRLGDILVFANESEDTYNRANPFKLGIVLELSSKVIKYIPVQATNDMTQANWKWFDEMTLKFNAVKSIKVTNGIANGVNLLNVTDASYNHRFYNIIQLMSYKKADLHNGFNWKDEENYIPKDSLELDNMRLHTVGDNISELCDKLLNTIVDSRASRKGIGKVNNLFDNISHIISMFEDFQLTAYEPYLFKFEVGDNLAEFKTIGVDRAKFSKGSRDAMLKRLGMIISISESKKTKRLKNIFTSSSKCA